MLGKNFLIDRREAIGLGLTVALLGSIGATACSSHSSNVCISPRTVSPVYPGDQDPNVTAANRSSWRLGVLATTNQPQADIIVGFQTPFNDAWQDSSPVSRGFANQLAMKIGPGAVRFSTEYISVEGAAACEDPPPTTFGPERTLKSFPKTATFPIWK